MEHNLEQNGVSSLLTALVLGLLVPAPALGQVGHVPEHSPYHDLRARQAASVVGGYLRGQRGTANVGPSDGPVFGIRYDRQVGAAVDIFLGLSVARLQRYVVDPTRTLPFRTSGPIDEDIATMETGLSLVLTGRKTWHGFVPYLGGGVGVGFDVGFSQDPYFQFNTKGILIPHVGFKWYPVQAFALKVEGRDVMWRLRYPEQFFASPTGSPEIPPVLKLSDPSSEWLHHPTILVSLGYTFTF